MNTRIFYGGTASIFLFAGILNAFDITNSTEIVLPRNAHPSSELAAKEITDYVKKISGTGLKTVREGSAAENRIVIGTLDTSTNIPVEIRHKLEAAGSPESFYISCKGNQILILGKTRVAELYGAYAFLDEKLGIRWFKAWTEEDPNEYVPKMEKIHVDDFELFREPAFFYRQLLHTGATGKVPVHGQTLAVRQGFQISRPWNFAGNFSEPFYMERVSNPAAMTGGHHTFVDAVPESLFEKHPEYFAMIDGKRVKGQQYCLSNPAVQNLVYEYICNLYIKYPMERANYLFGMIDVTTGWCECPECRKLDETEKFDHVNVSTRFHKVVSKIAARLYEKYPNAPLFVWAYHTYRTLPENVRCDPRMTVSYCIHGRCYGHELSDPGCERNIAQVQLIKKWLAITKKMLIREYSSCTPMFYCPVEHRQAMDLRFYKTLGIIGWQEEASFADAQFWPLAKKGTIDHRSDRFNSNWQWLYVTGKLLWNPDLDVKKLLDDAESKYYGKAYPAMKEYQALRRELWDNSSCCMGYPTRDQRRPQLLSVPESKERLFRYLREAEALAAGDKILLGRIARDRDWLTRYWVAPYEDMSKKIDKSYSAPTRKGEVTIDGNPSDPEWSRAFHTSDFKWTFGDREKPVPDNAKTTLSILSDKENLYFRIMAKVPDISKLVAKESEKDGKVWSDDCIEIFIMPPSAAQEYYHVAVNAKGTVYDARCPGNHKEVDLGVKAAAKVYGDHYVIEIQVPLAGIGKARRGALWRIHAARTCPALRNEGGGSMSLDGTEHHDSSGYRGIVIGSPRLFNGSFEARDKNGKPEHWNVDKGTSVQKISGGNAVRIGSYSHIFQLMYINPGLAQSKEARKITVSFKASGGPGKLSVSFLRYTDTPDPKEKHGYKRKIHQTENAGSFDLTPKTKVYSINYTIKPDEWVGLMFSYIGKENTSALVDDVSLMLQEE